MSRRAIDALGCPLSLRDYHDHATGHRFIRERLQTAAVGQIHIQQREIKVQSTQGLPRLGGGGCLRHLHPKFAQLRGEAAAQQRLILQQKQS